MLILDPPGTMTAVLARCRGKVGRKVIVNDPFRIIEKSGGGNCLFDLGPSSPTIRAGKSAFVADALVIPDPELEAGC